MNNTAQNLEKHVRKLCDEIGVRLAGSPQEYQAAEYIAQQFRQYSPNVTIEEFPVNERHITSEKLEVEINGQWVEFPCSLFSSAPSTDGKTIEAEIIQFDLATGYQKKDLSFMKGKAVIHLGCHIEDENNYRRLVEAAPAFILFVDIRSTGNVQLADGLFPAYVKKYGAVPCLNVAYMHAWKWLQRKATRARINVTGGIRQSKTTVVLCELKGTDPDSGVIYAGGHHDTQAGTVGADDNAIGSAAVIELARMLSAKPHKRTFRLISFGAEEQLSFGSAAYIRKHQEDIRKNGVFMYNFDSMGSALGWYEFLINANEETRKLFKNFHNNNDIYYCESTAICPYTDQFPFAACGVPGIWTFRRNCAAGLFYHHRVDNDPAIIGFEDCAKLVNTAETILTYLADQEDISKYQGIPADIQEKVDQQFNAVYGGF